MSRIVPVGGSHMSVALGSAVTEYRRRAFVRTVADSTEVSQDTLADWRARQALWEIFQDQTDLLAALQRYWVDLLRHAVYAQPRFPLGEDRVRELYVELAAEHPALRSILSGHQDDHAIFDSLEEERVLLARAAGNLHRVSTATLSSRGRELLETVPAQRTP